MHRILLTESGQAIADEDKARSDNGELELYPDDDYMPGREGVWTVSDDILIMLNTLTVYSSTFSLEDQAAAVAIAAGPIHSKPVLRQAFSLLCDLQLVEHEVLPNDHVRMLAEFFDALSHPDRLLMVFAMMHSVQGMSDLKTLIGKEASSVYYHISKLTDAGLVFSLGHGEGYIVNTGVLATCLHALVVTLRKDGDDEDNS